MKHHRPKRIILLFIILAISLSACAVPQTRSGSHSNSDSRFTQETTIDSIELEIKPAMRSHTLEIDLEVEAGQLSLELTDPKEEVQWSEVFEASVKYDESFTLDPIVGDWTLKITLEEASGSYKVRWEGSH